ncbi:hypothetical protein V2J09_022359 [Rumex salicifolius]
MYVVDEHGVPRDKDSRLSWNSLLQNYKVQLSPPAHHISSSPVFSYFVSCANKHFQTISNNVDEDLVVDEDLADLVHPTEVAFGSTRVTEVAFGST